MRVTITAVSRWMCLQSYESDGNAKSQFHKETVRTVNIRQYTQGRKCKNKVQIYIGDLMMIHGSPIKTHRF